MRGGETQYNMNLYNEDCLKVLEKIESESVDLVITDCPYRIVSGGCSKHDKHPLGGILGKRADKHGNKFYSNSKHISLTGIFNDYDSTTYAKEGKLFKHNDIKFSEWLPEIYRVLKQNTHCYIMISPRNLKELQQEAENVGFVFQQLIVWDKGNSIPNKYYLNSFELILMLRKGKAKNISNLGTKNIIRVPNIMRGRKHPTEKPVELMKILIENSSVSGDVVLDPFMGVGGAGVACMQTNRNFIGIEIDERYYKIAESRIYGLEEPKQMSIFDFI